MAVSSILLFALLLFSLGLAGFSTSASASASSSSSSAMADSSDNARAISIELYAALRQKGRPETVALRLQKAIQHFRYTCLRVNEYQIYNSQPNMMELKVGCVSSPTYGVSVAANGYLSVYGGNGILEAINGEDGRVFFFNADGSLMPKIVPEFRQYLSRVADKAKLGDAETKFYLGLIMPAIGFVVLAGLIMWLKSWRRMRYDTAYNQFLPSNLKDQLVEESEQVSPDLYKHPSDFYIAIGKRGKRRLFKHRFQGWLYRNYSIKLGEISHLPHMETDEVDEAEDY